MPFPNLGFNGSNPCQVPKANVLPQGYKASFLPWASTHSWTEINHILQHRKVCISAQDEGSASVVSTHSVHVSNTRSVWRAIWIRAAVPTKVRLFRRYLFNVWYLCSHLCLCFELLSYSFCQYESPKVLFNGTLHGDRKSLHLLNTMASSQVQLLGEQLKGGWHDRGTGPSEPCVAG